MSKFNGEVLEQRAITILCRMFDIYEQNLLCNIDLVVGNNRFPVHKLILVTNSDFFKSRINNTTSEIILEDSDEILAESVKKTIEFFYLGKIDLQLHLAVNIIKFSKMIEARELEEYCLAYLEKITNIKNFIFIEDFAKQYGYLQLLERTNVYIAENYAELIQEDEYLNMSCERLGELLQSDYLNVAREEQAFQGLKIWVQKNYEYRKKHLDTLLKYIRLPLLPLQFILNEVKPLCYDSLTCCQMLLDTIEYHHNPEKIPRFPSLNSKPRKCQQTVLVVGGYEDKSTLGKIEIYDAKNDIWSTYHNLNNKTTSFEAVVLKNKLITLGGVIDDKTTNKASCFDLATKETRELKAMQEERLDFAATVIDDQVFVIGGKNNKYKVLNSVERYDLVTNTWTNVAHMLTPRYNHVIAVVGKEIYAIGGSDEKNTLNTMEIYDTQQDKWTVAPPMKEKRSVCAAVVMGDHIYAIGGFDGYSELKSVERFDIKSHTWTSVANIPEKNWGQKAFAFDEKIICVGGEYSKSVLKYDPATDKWTDHGTISGPLSCFNLLLAPMHIMKNE
ncbi:kelch-like protein 1 isoform X2 [Arctopsyche grandis]|uniref:kelch-like protein 1 isoform X2 n=1 Tax=Arctopsyche grandis TaxID=121162 RepID=UPI00406D7811